MKATKKIQLEIYSDKADEFYLALLKYKISGKKDLEQLTALADAIHFDKDSLTDSFTLNEAQNKKINKNLLSIHTYLLKSKRDSADYFTVSKENFEKFQASSFGQELYDMFFLMEITKQWAGKEESAEVKSGIAMLSWFIGGLMKGLAESIGKSMNTLLNTAIAFNEKKPLNVKANKKGNLVCKSADETIEMEVFAEKNGQIRKASASDLEKLSEETPVYIKADNRIVRIKHIGDKIELTHYDKAKVKNQKLDLSEGTVLETISVPKDQYENAVEEEDGSFTHHPVNNSLEKAEVTVETTQPVVYNYEEMLKETQKDKKRDEKPTVQSSASIFAMLDENFASYLRLPKNNPEKVEARNKIIISIYELLKKYYPEFTTIHPYTTITGYIASRMELLDTEEKFDESGRSQPYRKYLRDNVYQILKSNSIV